MHRLPATRLMVFSLVFFMSTSWEWRTLAARRKTSASRKLGLGRLGLGEGRLAVSAEAEGLRQAGGEDVRDGVGVALASGRPVATRSKGEYGLVAREHYGVAQAKVLQGGTPHVCGPAPPETGR